jgi:hypothetical protein
VILGWGIWDAWFLCRQVAIDIDMILLRSAFSPFLPPSYRRLVREAISARWVMIRAAPCWLSKCQPALLAFLSLMQPSTNQRCGPPTQPQRWGTDRASHAQRFTDARRFRQLFECWYESSQDTYHLYLALSLSLLSDEAYP